MKKKILLFLLVFALLISVIACSKTDTDDNVPADDATDDVTDDVSDGDDVMTPYGKYDETIVLSVGRFEKKLPEGVTYDNNAWSNYVKDVLNVEIKTEWTAARGEYDQKVVLCVASGDIPDVMGGVGNRMLFLQMADEGLIADITEVFDKCFSPFLSEQYDTFDGKLEEAGTIDGKLMAVPGTNIGGAHNLIWIRNDWLEKVNMDPPETLDDIIAIGQAFIEQDPGENGSGNTIGLTGVQKVTGYYNSMHGFDTVFSLYGAYPRQWIEDASGNVVYGSVAPEMKAALTKLNEMYELGIIDPQFGVRTGGDSNEIVVSGLGGMMFGAWWAPYYPLVDGVAQNPDADWKPYLAPLDGNGKLNVYTQDPVNNYMVVSSECEYPEAAIKVMNVENDIFRAQTPEGEAIVNAANAAGEDWLGIIDTQIDYKDTIVRFRNALLVALESGDTSGLRADYVSAYEATLRNNENPRAVAGDWLLATARLEGPALAYAPEVEFHDNVYYGTTPSMETNWASMETLEDETLIQFIMGERPIEEFDDFVAQWYDLGGEEITAEVAGLVE